MNKFTPEGIAAIEKIKACLQEAQKAFSTLNSMEEMSCLELHHEGRSLNHCVRWGLVAAEEVGIAVNEAREMKTFTQYKSMSEAKKMHSIPARASSLEIAQRTTRYWKGAGRTKRQSVN